MDEQPETTTPDSVEEPEAAETTEAESTETPPWGDDFDPGKAWSTIQNLRGESKELKQFQQDAREKLELLEALRDPQRQAEALRDFGIELEDTEDRDEEDDGGDPYLTREEWDRHNAEQQAQRAEQAFTDDLNGLAKGADVELSEWDRARLYGRTMQLGADADALKKALDELVDDRKASEKEAIERYRKSKGGPRVLPGGSPATDDNNRLDIPDDAERHRRMTERLRMGQQQ